MTTMTDRVGLVTGGARGIGRAIGECLQREGAHVVLLDCDQDAGEAAARETGMTGRNPVRFVQADLGSTAGFEAVSDFIANRYGHLDMLFNNAGIETGKSFENTTAADWEGVLGVNLRGAFLLTQAVLHLFPESGGAIVNISSIHSTHAFPESVVYACSKAGMIALTRNLALELAKRHIRVNAICPGYIDTRLWDEHLRHSANPDEVAAHTTALHPVGRRGVPADIAEAALYLASDAASFVTGTQLVVDGGLTIRAHP
jgi:NAD(P)-dependent dehydrogenase (short-subunit alcohol dehydrogenase family)